MERKALITESSSRHIGVTRLSSRTDIPRAGESLGVRLQRTVGNQAIQHLLQTKLKLNQPGDLAEDEADRLAEQVVQMKSPSCPLNGRPDSCRARQSNGIQQKGSPGATDTGSSVSDGFLRGLGPGQALTSTLRGFMEPRFGEDFGQVRVHTDARAAASARALQARAYTFGHNIVFGATEYSPDSAQGRKLLAHELVHVVQQSATGHAGGHKIIQRVPAISECDTTEQRNIIRAQTRGIAWVRFALTQLSSPDTIAPELSYHFLASPEDSATVDAIRGELLQVAEELNRDAIVYACVPRSDSRCRRERSPRISGFAYPNSYETYFCGDVARSGADSLTSTLIHEALHAKAPGLPDGPYLGEADYPGRFPLNNTDAYTGLVRDIARGIFGVPLEPVEEEAGTLPEFGGISSVSPIRLSTDLHGFPSGTATLTAAGQAFLMGFVEDWLEYEPTGPVGLGLAGYTDGTGAWERDRELGLSRAEAVRDYLLEQLSLFDMPQPMYLAVASYGHTRPFTRSRTRTGQALNRRVSIELRRLRPRG